MKPINGFKAEAPTTGYPMLPKGIYTAVIQNVMIEGTAPDQRLVLRIDITEGEHAGYYTKRYHSESSSGSSRYAVKYKGDYRIQIPDQGNTKREHYDWDLRSFNNAIWAIEDSNDGYHWDWNEMGLKGKAVGINVRQGSYNGSPYTQIGRLESIKMMREGKVKQMQDMKPRFDGDRAGEAVQVTTGSTVPGFTVSDEEVPF